MKALGIDVAARGWIAIAVAVMALLFPVLGHAAEAGKFQFVIGDIKVVSAAGVERVPVKGQAFQSGETIVTGASGSAQIRMSDGGTVAVRPDTQLKLDHYVFNGREDGTERKVVSLIRGGFRAITGLIGNRNKENYRILTPSATIGIRGTDHEAVVLVPDNAGGYPAGTYDRVYRGATIIETDTGKLIVKPNQVGFTPGRGVAPVLLPKIPGFLDARSQKPDAAKEKPKEEAGTTVPDDAGRLEVAKSDALASPAADSGLNVDGAREDTFTLRNPLDVPTVPGGSSDTDRTQLMATPSPDASVQAVSPVSSSKGAPKAEASSTSKTVAASPAPRAVTPAQVATIGQPTASVATPTHGKAEKTTVSGATAGNAKGGKKP